MDNQNFPEKAIPRLVCDFVLFKAAFDNLMANIDNLAPQTVELVFHLNEKVRECNYLVQDICRNTPKITTEY